MPKLTLRSLTVLQIVHLRADTNNSSDRCREAKSFKNNPIYWFCSLFFLLLETKENNQEIWRSRAYICFITNATVCLLNLVFCSAYLFFARPPFYYKRLREQLTVKE